MITIKTRIHRQRPQHTYMSVALDEWERGLPGLSLSHTSNVTEESLCCLVSTARDGVIAVPVVNACQTIDSRLHKLYILVWLRLHRWCYGRIVLTSSLLRYARKGQRKQIVGLAVTIDCFSFSCCISFSRFTYLKLCDVSYMYPFEAWRMFIHALTACMTVTYWASTFRHMR